MKKIAHSIFVILLSFVVFLTTTGFNVFHHKCNHLNNNQYSIFLEYNCCHQFSLGVSFREKENNELSFNKEDCCSTRSSYLKNENPFQVNFIQQLDIPVDFVNIQYNIESVQQNPFVEVSDFNYDINGPPLIDKHFFFLIYKLKLAPPSC